MSSENCVSHSYSLKLLIYAMERFSYLIKYVTDTLVYMKRSSLLFNIKGLLNMKTQTDFHIDRLILLIDNGNTFKL